MQLGKINRLIVKKSVEFGVYLDSDAGEILLPKKYVPDGASVGEPVDVFIYKDSEDRIIATTLVPRATVGEFAYLRVADVAKFGAFLEWGLEKDLLVPSSEQAKKMETGKSYVVRIFVDEKTGRITGSTKINRFLEYDEIPLAEGDTVDLMVYQFTDLGINVIVNSRYSGMLYRNEVFQQLNVGDRLKGFVKRIREDKKIDVKLAKGGYSDVEDAKKTLLKKLKDSKGVLPLGDNSPPELIRDTLQMSKKTFKKAVGGLYRDGVIELKENGIRLKEAGPEH